MAGFVAGPVPFIVRNEYNLLIQAAILADPSFANPQV
jgi:hypothetical protein